MPRAVQRATAADVPYSMSSGCATTQSTRRKDSSGRAGKAMPAILPELFPAGDGRVGPKISSETRPQNYPLSLASATGPYAELDNGRVNHERDEGKDRGKWQKNEKLSKQKNSGADS